MLMVLCLFPATAQTPEVHETILSKTNYRVIVAKIVDRLSVSEIAPPVGGNTEIEIVPVPKPAGKPAPKKRGVCGSKQQVWRTLSNGHRKYRCQD